MRNRMSTTMSMSKCYFICTTDNCTFKWGRHQKDRKTKVTRDDDGGTTATTKSGSLRMKDSRQRGEKEEGWDDDDDDDTLLFPLRSVITVSSLWRDLLFYERKVKREIRDNILSKAVSLPHGNLSHGPGHFMTILEMGEWMYFLNREMEDQ